MRFFAVAAIMLFCATAAQAQVYKWTDARGQVHYSATPPPDASASEIRIAPPPPSARSVSDAAADAADTPAEADTASAPTADGDITQEALFRQNCEIARQNLAVLEDPSIRRFREDGGETVYYTDEQRQEKVEQAQAMVETYCKQASKP